MDHMLVDGVPVKKDGISPLDWGCAYGYGLFETILVLGQRPVFLERHLQRMRLSAGFLRLVMPEEADVTRWVRNLVGESQGPGGRLKISLLGKEPLTGQEKIAARIVLSFQPGLPYPEFLYKTGVTIGLLNLTKNEKSSLVRHKTTNYLENILAREQARKNGWFEGIFYNTKGRLCEGTVSNLFIVKEDKIVTPGIREGLLPGVTREVVIKLARRGKLPVKVGTVTEKDLSAASEIFLTNSLFGMMPVTRIGDSILGDGKPGLFTRTLMTQYQSMVTAKDYL